MGVAEEGSDNTSSSFSESIFIAWIIFSSDTPTARRRALDGNESQIRDPEPNRQGCCALLFLGFVWGEVLADPAFVKCLNHWSASLSLYSHESRKLLNESEMLQLSQTLVIPTDFLHHLTAV